MFNKIKPSYEIWGIFSIILSFTLIRLFINSHIELSPDEAYYWYWSKHLDLSYADHPPMVAYVMALFTAIGGNTEFFVRLGGLILSMGTLFIMFHTSRTLFPANKITAWELLFIFNLTLLFSAGCIVQTPDEPMLFFLERRCFPGKLHNNARVTKKLVYLGHSFRLRIAQQIYDDFNYPLHVFIFYCLAGT